MSAPSTVRSPVADTAAAQGGGDPHAPRRRAAEFRFYEELNDFLPPSRRKTAFEYVFSGRPSVLDAIQALGVPHTEVDLVLVDGVSVDFSHHLSGGERVAVYPVFERLDITPLARLRPRPLRRSRFVLDACLGKLARHLRLLGFDARWQPGSGAAEIIDASLDERRIILTRDVDLLKHARVTHGHWLRREDAEGQLEEVLLAFDLLGLLRPFSRCMECNGEIDPVGADDDLADVDPAIRARFDAFRRCRDCGRAYWKGSHYDEMERFVRAVRNRALVRALRQPSAYPHATGEIRVVETHISSVLLTGDYAYKVKKPVELGFLDFSKLEQRRHFCEEELRINRRTAPALYLDVVPIGRGDGGLRVGALPALDYAVKMRQFPHAARLDRCLQQGRFGAAGARELAVTVARFHAGLAPRADAAGEPERTLRPARKNFAHLDTSGASDRLRQKLAVVEAWTADRSDALAGTILRRAESGRVRECHGDLHLENIVFLDDRFVLFDAIEFNPELRWIDVANDIAFLVMDLLARGCVDLAHEALNAWLEETGDYDALAVMRFYVVYRAMVRAVVAGIRHAGQATAGRGAVPGDAEPGNDRSFRPGYGRYVGLAAEWVDTPPARLILMYGVSGSGKTWASGRLLREWPALRVRSDLERKRLAGIAASARAGAAVGEGLYAAEMTERTYDALAAHCETGLRAGFTMIADASFLARRHRQRFYALGERLGVPVSIVECSADRATLEQRIRRRAAAGRDASDADLAVLDHQLRSREPLDDAERRRVLHIDDGPSPASLTC